MKYHLFVYESATELAKRDHAEDAPAYWAAYSKFTKDLNDAGVSRGGALLQGPHSGTTVRVQDASNQIQDGPYADTKDQLGGYFIIEVYNLDEALHWAAQCPCAQTGGACEVRPAGEMKSE